MDWKTLLTQAKTMIGDGKVDEAKILIEQAEALKSADALLENKNASGEIIRDEIEALQSESAAIREDIDAIKSAPAISAGITESAQVKTLPFEKGTKGFGDFMACVRLAETDKRIPGPLKELRDMASKSMKALGASETVPADGGFLVQQDHLTEILTKMHDASMLFGRTRKLPLGPNSNGITINAIDESSRVDGSRGGGVQVFWRGEGVAANATKPTFRLISRRLGKLIGHYFATDELIADTTLLGSVASDEFTSELAFEADKAIFGGTGVGQPQGFSNSTARVEVPKEGGQTANTVVFDNITKMWSRLWARSAPNAVWFVNQDVWPELFNLSLPVGTGGSSVFMPAGGLSGSPFATLLGRPIIPIEHAKTLGTAGDIVLADLSQYLTFQKGGIQSASSAHVQFLTDEMTFRFTWRMNGQPSWDLPLTPAQGSNTQSPFVTLATRA